MNVVEIQLAGKSYPLCLSLSAMERIDNEFGGIEKMGDLMSGGNLSESLPAVRKALAITLAAGYAYRLAAGESAEKPPEDAIGDLIGIDDLPKLIAAISEAVSASNERGVEAVEPPKNAAPASGA